MLGTSASIESSEGSASVRRWRPRGTSSSSSFEVITPSGSISSLSQQNYSSGHQRYGTVNSRATFQSFATSIVTAIRYSTAQLRAILPSYFKVAGQPNLVNAALEAPANDSKANQLIEFYSRVSARGLPWSEPHIASGDDGDISLEWWKGNKKLTIYLSESGPRFIKVWGPSVFHEMEDGEVTSGSDLDEPYLWLFR